MRSVSIGKWNNQTELIQTQNPLTSKADCSLIKEHLSVSNIKKEEIVFMVPNSFIVGILHFALEKTSRIGYLWINLGNRNMTEENKWSK